MSIVILLSSAELRRKPVNRFIINQSFIDLGACVISIFIKIYDSLDIVPFGISQEVFCRLWVSTYMFWVMAVASAYNLTFLTIERFLAITSPMQYNIDDVNKRLPFVLALAWLLGFIFPFVNICITYVDNQACLFTYKYNPDIIGDLIPIYFFIIDCGIPAIIMVFAYIKMGLVLRGSRLNKTISSDKTHQQTDTIRQAEVNIYQTCVMLMIVFVLCWSNNCIGVALFMIGYLPHMNTTYHNVSVVLILMNSCINPYIYALRYKEFQQRIRTLVCQMVISVDE